MSYAHTFTELETALAELQPNTFSPYMLRPERMIQLMDFLHNPQDSYKVIHVAGTSGKTSTAYYVAALLKAGGYRVGMTISPHVDTPNERVQVDLAPLPETVFCERFSAFLEMIKPSGIVPTYFEAFTAFAFWEFREQKVEYAVVEVGVGGLVDSTNVISREDKVCIITDIGYDHTKILGETLGEIAGHKAGIIQLQNVVFCYEQSDAVMTPIRARSEQKHADLHILHTVKGYASQPLFQRRNLTLAVAAISFVFERDGHSALTARQLGDVARLRIPARMEVRKLKGKTIILDAAHNSQKMQALTRSLQERYPDATFAVLIGLLNARARFVGRLFHELEPLHPRMLITGFPSDVRGEFSSADPTKVAQAAEDIFNTEQITVFTDPVEAFGELMRCPEQVVVVTGSFYLLNHIRPLL